MIAVHCVSVRVQSIVAQSNMHTYTRVNQQPDVHSQSHIKMCLMAIRKQKRKAFASSMLTEQGILTFEMLTEKGIRTFEMLRGIDDGREVLACTFTFTGCARASSGAWPRRSS